MSLGLHTFIKMFHNDYAASCAGVTHEQAQAAGYVDVYDYLLWSEDQSRMQVFLLGLPVVIRSAKARYVLLDGITREYTTEAYWDDFASAQSDRKRGIVRKAARPAVTVPAPKAAPVKLSVLNAAEAVYNAAPRIDVSSLLIKRHVTH